MAKQSSEKGSFFQKIAQWFSRLGQKIRGLFAKKSPEQADSETTILFTDVDKLRRADRSMPLNLPEEQLEGKDKYPSSLLTTYEPRPKFVLRTILTTAKFFVLAIIVLGMAALGSVLGLANAYLGTTPDLNTDLLTDQDLTSYIYDRNGTLITSYAGIENRDYAKLEDIPKQLQQAVISIEDVRFYHHNGIDFKRLLGSFLSNLSNDSTSGGSTITQQLVKNKLLTSERSYKRKIQEAYLAVQLENAYSKDQILEAYLNTIPLGGSNYGVKAAAKDYFGKELNELSLRECACLAGITQYPWMYNPRRAYYVTGKIEYLNERIDTVLERMYTAGYITLEEKEAAQNDTLTVLEESSTTELYPMPHFVEYAVHDVISNFLEKRGLEDNAQNRTAIENELRTGGYHIYTTVDPEAQADMEKAAAEYKNYPKMRKQSDSVIVQTNPDGSKTEIAQPQAAAVVLDQATGQIKGLIGGRTTPTMKKSLNRAYQNRMPVGSAIKPIAIYGPAFEKGAGLGTVVPNIPVPIDGWNTKTGYPTSSQGTYGPTTIRKAISSSLNIVAARVLQEIVTVEDSYDYLVQLGINPDRINKDGVGLALGTSGITVIEMAGAYACIANGGTFIEPISFTEVRDSQDNVILSAKETQDVRTVFSKSTCFMLVDALRTVVTSGTGTTANIKGMTVAGKTGTTDDARGVFFAGITPYYTSTIWIGHDNYKPLRRGSGGGRNAGPLWKTYMSSILQREGLTDKPILDYTANDCGVRKYSVCSVSGKLATGACSHDSAGHTPISEYFYSGTAPTETCDYHVSSLICSESHMPASEFCPAELVSEQSGIRFPADSPYLKLGKGKLLAMFPNYLGAISSTEGEAGSNVCNIHTEEWANSQQELAAAIAEANAALKTAQSFLDQHSAVLTQAQINTLNNEMNNLRNLIANSTSVPSAILAQKEILLNTVSAMKAALPDSPTPSETPSETPAPSE